MPDSPAQVRIERPSDAIAVIRLDNPPMSVLSDSVAGQLAEAAAHVAADNAVRAVVIYGAEKVFAAGADVKEFVGMDQSGMIRHGLRLERAVAAIAAIPKPVIAAVTGVALGGGCELALAADLGIMPGAGGTQRLPRLVGPVAKDLVYSGRFVPADEALRVGLVDSVVPASDVLTAAIDRGLDVDLDTGRQIERILFASLFSTADKEIGVQSFLEHGAGKAVFPPPAP